MMMMMMMMMMRLRSSKNPNQTLFMYDIFIICPTFNWIVFEMICLQFGNILRNILLSKNLGRRG
jgi:hypothetical protein